MTIENRQLKRFDCEGGGEKGDNSQKRTRKRLFCLGFFKKDETNWEEVVDYRE